MQFEITILATNNYDLRLLADRSKFLETYLFEEPGGFVSVESTEIDSSDNVRILIKYLFNNEEPLTEIYKDNTISIIDLSNHGRHISTFNDLENFYPQWLIETGRENNMDEYGMFIGFIGYLQRHIADKFILLMIAN
jgi:hypothetical protein